MTTDRHTDFNDHPKRDVAPSPARVLAVALSRDALAQTPRHVLAPDAEMVLSALAQVGARDVTGPDAPGLILAPLTAKGFDAMDLLATLTQAGFGDRVLVLAPHVPDVPLVRADVLAQAPTLNVDVIALDGSSALHLH
ncbi:hypothetical protein KUL25_05250 [Rhodobacteraceae bacterium N5(2021)]|uniref:Uncharacterized protein n=1 Tax=Gymnodinialimonas phycosphaerae TaxID=2841589 RepID=A0A975TWE6_9RHOB|nr:hypothetical protein [Gymnodinialimonas phycosphaerae]MBY4892166.1 hypothetical protein [Gymnodinialimonas phycosphaerae]